jgi:hypothetical protein
LTFAIAVSAAFDTVDTMLSKASLIPMRSPFETSVSSRWAGRHGRPASNARIDLLDGKPEIGRRAARFRKSVLSNPCVG